MALGGGEELLPQHLHGGGAVTGPYIQSPFPSPCNHGPDPRGGFHHISVAYLTSGILADVHRSYHRVIPFRPDFTSLPEPGERLSCSLPLEVTAEPRPFLGGRSSRVTCTYTKIEIPIVSHLEHHDLWYHRCLRRLLPWGLSFLFSPCQYFGSLPFGTGPIPCLP